MALGLVLALHEGGRRIPEDISVVGFDGLALAEFSHPPLTTVRQDFEQIGQELVDLVLTQMRAQGAAVARHDRVAVPTELVIRASTGPAPAR